VASGLNALAAVTVEDFAPMVVRHIPTEREALVSKLLGNSKPLDLKYIKIIVLQCCFKGYIPYSFASIVLLKFCLNTRSLFKNTARKREMFVIVKV